MKLVAKKTNKQLYYEHYFRREGSFVDRPV